MHKKKNYHHLLETIDVMIEHTVEKVINDNKQISCSKGCSHCCYLLVEVSWEEATLLAEWVEAQHPKIKEKLIKNISENAEKARAVFSPYKRTQKYTEPFFGELNFPDMAYDRYFYKNKIPCPFLIDDSCSAYEVRPTPCRLHMVTSPSELCSRQTPDDVPGYEVPQDLEDLREEIVPMTEAFFKNGHWGHLGIMVERALEAINNDDKPQ